MRIRTKFIITFLLLSLTPPALIGVIAYKNGKEAIKKNLGSNFQQIAHTMIEKVDQIMYGMYRDARTWSQLDIMQEVITDDVDGKISSFLMELIRAHVCCSSINVLNSQGEVVASSDFKLIGGDFKGEDFYREALKGKPYVEDVHFDELSKGWVVTFSFPIQADFEKERIIGVLSLNWNAAALANIAQFLVYKEEGGQYHTHLMLIRKDGLIISAPERERENIFKRNLVRAGLKSALLAAQGEEGYLVETDEHNREALIGYDYSKGYADFPGLGWMALVTEGTNTAFASAEQLKIVVLGVGAAAALLVIIASLILARRMVNPILEISRAARRVARGDFEAKIDWTSGDEVGQLAASFNRMTADLKKYKGQLEEHSRTLEEKVEERTRELRQAQSQLVQSGKLAAIGELGAGVAHELNNPVGGILGYAQYLLEKVRKPGFKAEDFKTCERPLGYIEKEAKRCKTIVENLLKFSRRSPEKFELLNINQVLEDTLTITGHQLMMKRVELKKALAPGLKPVQGNANQLQQVFTNLILNAQQAMPEGGSLTITTRTKEDFIEISFTDTGCGISPGNRDKIFDPFFTTKLDWKGTGLGLSVSYEIIQNHKGRIEVESEVGKGTSFTIKLPAGRKDNASAS